MKNSNFKILKKDSKTRARLGILNTPHGKVYTPSYVIVATYGNIRHLSPSDIKKTKTQIVISNTYHLWNKSKVHKMLGLKLPVMTDSGGFQVFSLAFGQRNAKKIFPSNTAESANLQRKNVKITDKGVHFVIDGQKRFLSPEISMQIQKKLGADMIFAFDECTYLFDTFEYNKKAMERTHRWALENLKFKAKSEKRGDKQMLFGIVQGGKYKNLRVKSAKFIGSLPFDGFGIGGSFGKEEMPQMLKWVIPHLPEDKPRHLLGVGRIEDIFRAVENGVDLFDCVIPTREARHGRLWTKSGKIDIRKGRYANGKGVIEKGCKCPVCAKKVPRSEVRQKVRYALLHNIWFFNNVVEEIRESIKKGKFTEYKNKFLKKFKI